MTTSVVTTTRQPIRWVETSVVLRAAAICQVVLNHSGPHWRLPAGLSALGWGGGMTFLLMLSGFNFAKFALHHQTSPAAVNKSIFALARQIFVPSLVMVLTFFVIHRRFDLAELLFVKNWITLDRIANFPTWYVQVLLQMFGFFYLLFWLKPVGAFILRRPLSSALVLWAAALAVFAGWSTDGDGRGDLALNLPHLWLWNFALGWALFFCIDDRAKQTGARSALATAIVLVSAAVVYEPSTLRFWWLLVGTCLLIWVPRVPLPRAIAALARIVGQATLAIFLLHRLLFIVYRHSIGRALHSTFAIVASAILGSVAVSVLVTATLRAWRVLRREGGGSTVNDAASARLAAPGSAA